ncbi:glycosyltransferase family 4 protein [bacterium LRH843]|nr:glycosyltransferase family 4 protein [bacterium LRH843]
MNIWIFNHYAIAPGTSGITRHFDLAKELVKLGHEVTIFASSFDHQSRKEAHLKNTTDNFKEEVYDGVRYVWVKTFPYNKNDWRRVINILSYTLKTNKFVKTKFNEKPDIIIGSLMHPLAPILAYKVAKKLNAAFYFEVRDLWPQSLIDLGKVSPRNPIVWALDKLESFLYRKADKIIVLFDKASDYIVSKGFSSKKIIYLPNGIDPERFNGNNISVPQNIKNSLTKIPTNKFIGIYSGAHGLANNLDVILDSAKELTDIDDIHYVLIGDGPEKQRLIKKANDLGLHNVSFLDSVPKDYLPLFLERANVGLLPLKKAPVFKWGISPNKLYDYMASKLPVLLVCDLEDTIVDKAKSGYVVKGNNMVFELNSLMVKLNENREQSMQMGRNGHSYVMRNNSWDVLAKGLIEKI